MIRPETKLLWILIEDFLKLSPWSAVALIVNPVRIIEKLLFWKLGLSVVF